LERLVVESGVSTLPLPGGIVGLLFQGMAVAVNRGDGGAVHASQLDVEVRSPNGTPDYWAVRRVILRG